MGFGNIATTIILFISVLLLSTGVLVVMQNNLEESRASMQSQADLLNNQIKTSVDITSTNYTAGNVRIYVINSGKTILKTDKLDFFLNDEYIPRNDSSRTINIESSTDLKNPGLWDPDEVIRVDINKTLTSGTHRVSILTQYVTKDEETFST